MPIAPDNYLQTISDGFVAVRTKDGTLLGCIPGSPPTEDYLQSPIGPLEVRAALMYCIVPDEAQIATIRSWPGFIPLAGGQLDLARPAVPSDPDDQSDIGQPV